MNDAIVQVLKANNINLAFRWGLPDNDDIPKQATDRSTKRRILSDVIKFA